MRRIRHVIRWLLASLGGLLLLEGACSVYWLARDYAAFHRALPRAIAFSEERQVRYDPELGWLNLASRHFDNFYGPDRHLTLNAQGFRGQADITDKAAGQFRLVCLGDSFTLGYGVGDRDVWPAVVEQLHPGVEAINMGCGGYSVGQCVLWFQRDGLRLQPDAVVLALVTDDIWRMAGTRMLNGYGKPTFMLRDGRIDVGNQPVPARIGAGQPIVERWRTLAFLEDHGGLLRTLALATRTCRLTQAVPDQEGQLAIAVQLIDDLHAQLSARGIAFALVLMPELLELTDTGAQESFQQVASRFKGLSETRRFPFVTLLGAFAGAPPQAEPLFNRDDPWHHYSVAGYRLVATEINSLLVPPLARQTRQ